MTRTTKAKVCKQSVPRDVRRKVMAVLRQPYTFMDSPEFYLRRIEKELFGPGCEPTLPDMSWYQPTYEDLDKEVANSPKLMSSEEERLMFLRFNYSKRKLLQLKRKIQRQGLTPELAEEVLLWHRRVNLYRDYLVRTNLALVLAMAKRSRLSQVDFADVISEGNIALLRAIEKFRVDRGFKFSTYACRAILKAFSRMAMKQMRHRARFPVEFEPEMEKSDWADRRHEDIERECIEELKNIVNRNLADLTEIEQTVIRRRFNWEQSQGSPQTLEEVGRVIGVTKERVRQIQNKALAKIRLVMENGVLRAKPAPGGSEASTAAVVN